MFEKSGTTRRRAPFPRRWRPAACRRAQACAAPAADEARRAPRCAGVRRVRARRARASGGARRRGAAHCAGKRVRRGHVLHAMARCARARQARRMLRVQRSSVSPHTRCLSSLRLCRWHRCGVCSAFEPEFERVAAAYGNASSPGVASPLFGRCVRQRTACLRVLRREVTPWPAASTWTRSAR